MKGIKKGNSAYLKRRNRQLIRIANLMKTGLSQKQTAKVIGVTEKTLYTWLDQVPEIREQIRAVMIGEMEDILRTDDSLSAFMAFLTIQKPRGLKTIETLYQQFINQGKTTKNVCTQYKGTPRKIRVKKTGH